MRLPLIPLLLVPPALAQAGQTGQTPFAAPAPDDSAHLIRLSFPSRDATEFAFSTLEAHGIDVWQRSARSLHLAAPPSTLTSILPFSPPALVAPVASLLAQPTIQASYNLAHSNAVVRNITADRSAVRGDEMHQSFHPYDNLVQIMQALVDEFPGYAEMVQVAESSEGRPVWGLKVTNLSCALPDDCGDDLQVELEDDDDEEDDEDGSDAFWRKKHKGKKGRKHKPKRPEYPHKLGFVISGTQHSREVRFDVGRSSSLPCSLTILHSVDRRLDCAVLGTRAPALEQHALRALLAAAQHRLLHLRPGRKRRRVRLHVDDGPAVAQESAGGRRRQERVQGHRPQPQLGPPLDRKSVV